MQTALRLADFLEQGAGSEPLVDVCFTQTARRADHDYAIAAIGTSHHELARELQAKAQLVSVSSTKRSTRRARPVCFAFEGSSVWPGMGRALLDQEITFADAAMRCDLALRPLIGFSVLEQLFAGVDPGANNALLFTVQTGLAAVCKQLTLKGDVIVAKGAGILAAAVATGEMTLADAAKRLAEGEHRAPQGQIIDLAERTPADLSGNERFAAVVSLGSGSTDWQADDTCHLACVRKGHDERRTLLETAAGMWLCGRSPRWRGLFPAGASVVSLPPRAWQRRHFPANIANTADSWHTDPGPPPAAQHMSAQWGGLLAERDLPDVIRGHAAALLGLKPAEVDPERPLAEHGLDSLTARALQNALRKLGVGIALEPLARGASVNDLAALAIHAQLPPPQLEPDPPAGNDPFPLTAIQHAYWVGRSPDFDLGGVSCHLYLELEGRDFDVGRFGDALNRVIERHEMLRAVVDVDGRQRVLGEVARYEPVLIDLRGVGDPEGELERVRSELSHQLLASDCWPLFDIRLARLSDLTVRVMMSLDLLVADGASLLLFASELGSFYSDPARELEPLGVTFRDYVLAERALSSDGAGEGDWEYWSDRLDTLPAAPRLPLACEPADLVGPPRFKRRSHTLTRAQWATLREQAAARGLTPSVLLCAAFCEVLARFCPDGPFTLNLTTYNRLPVHPDIGGVIGDFTSLSLLEVDRLGDTFEARARRLQAQLWRDLEHRAVNGVEVIRELARRRGQVNAQMPVVFTSTLGLQDEGAPFPLDAIGEIVYAISQTPQVWLDHQLYERNGELELSWDSVEELFPPGLLAAMFETYTDLIHRLATNEAFDDDQAVRLTTREMQQIRQVNRTEAAIPSGMLHDGFLEQAEANPDAVAVLAGEQCLTYGELERRSGALASSLAGRGEIVCVSLRKGIEQVIAVLGVLRSGQAYVPVDPDMPSERFERLIARVGTRTVLTDRTFECMLVVPDGVEICLIDDQLAATSVPAPVRRSPTDLAYVIFTSGSTGEPKGVMVDHRAALNTITDVNRRFALSRGDRVLALSALSFDLSVWDIFGTLSAGATIVMPDPDLMR